MYTQLQPKPSSSTMDEQSTNQIVGEPYNAPANFVAPHKLVGSWVYEDEYRGGISRKLKRKTIKSKRKIHKKSISHKKTKSYKHNKHNHSKTHKNKKH